MAIMTMGKVYERLAFRLTTWGSCNIFYGRKMFIVQLTFSRDASNPV